MDQLIRRYLQSLVSERNYSPNTIAAYLSDLGQVVRFLGNEMWEAEGLLRYSDYLRRRHTAASWKRKIEAIKSLFRFLVGQGLVDKDPSAVLRRPRVDVGLQRRQEGWEPVVVGKLRDRAIIETLRVGVKVSELVDLTLDDLDLENGQVVVREKNGFRVVSLPGEVRDYLVERPKTKDRAVFLNWTRGKLTRHGVRLILKKHGVMPRYLSRLGKKSL